MNTQESFSADLRIKLLTSEKNVVEVASWRKVKKIKGQNFRLLLTIFLDRATEVSARAMELILTRAILIL